MTESKTTVPSPNHASDIEAMVAASGHTEADAIRILDALMIAGWALRPVPASNEQRTRKGKPYRTTMLETYLRS